MMFTKDILYRSIWIQKPGQSLFFQIFQHRQQMQDHLGLVFLSFLRIQLPNRRVAFELIAFVVQKSL